MENSFDTGYALNHDSKCTEDVFLKNVDLNDGWGNLALLLIIAGLFGWNRNGIEPFDENDLKTGTELYDKALQTAHERGLDADDIANALIDSLPN